MPTVTDYPGIDDGRLGGGGGGGVVLQKNTLQILYLESLTSPYYCNFREN